VGRSGIERGRGLIAQQNIRMFGNRTRDTDALLLPTAQLRRVCMVAALQTS